jgi:hypothetical protein
MFVQLQKSMMIYFAKNTSRANRRTAKLVYLVSNAARAASWSMVWLARRDAVTKSNVKAALAALRFHLQGVEPS